MILTLHYLYFPLENRIYRVESPYLYKDFMRDGVYYKVNLVKWQDTSNVLQIGATGASAAIIVDELQQTFDIFEDEIQKEYEQITKPQQYNTINVGKWDFVRSEINENLCDDITLQSANYLGCSSTVSLIEREKSGKGQWPHR